VSVATGIGPAELVELDGAMFDALVEQVDRRWTPELELAAATLETSSALLVAYLRAHTRKRLTLEPVKVPRPAWVTADGEAELELAAPARVSVTELAELADKVVEPANEGPNG
jgi:hypothetical protein